MRTWERMVHLSNRCLSKLRNGIRGREWEICGKVHYLLTSVHITRTRQSSKAGLPRFQALACFIYILLARGCPLHLELAKIGLPFLLGWCTEDFTIGSLLSHLLFYSLGEILACEMTMCSLSRPPLFVTFIVSAEANLAERFVARQHKDSGQSQNSPCVFFLLKR